MTHALFHRLASIVICLCAGCASVGERTNVSSPSALPDQSAPLDATRFAAIDDALRRFISARQMPGAAFHLERMGEVHQVTPGHQTYTESAPAIAPNTIFDAASLTKVVVTATAVQLLIEDGKLEMEAPVSRHLPECGGAAWSAMTLRHLLTHTSGLKSGLPARPAWRGKDAALKLACSEMPTHAPGTLFRYSDINFILLGLIIERASGQPLDQFAQMRIFAPLGMTRSGYSPQGRFNANDIAPTQMTAPGADATVHGDLPRGQELRGVVHDPTARFMGGVAGHAGLFTTLDDLARFGRMMVNGGELEGKRYLSKASIERLTTVQSPDAAHWRRSAGWDIESPYSSPRGKHFPVGSFGHTGFTGCILWIDPFSKTFFIFLSNRVYPNDKGMILPLYSELGTLSAQTVTGFDFTRMDGALTPRPPLPVPAPQQP